MFKQLRVMLISGTGLVVLAALSIAATPRSRAVAPHTVAISRSQQAAIVTRHNMYRASVSPRPATPLQAIAWSDTLATRAATFATRCTASTVQERTGIGGFSYIGENLYISPVGSAFKKNDDSDYDLIEAIDFWASELEKFDLTSPITYSSGHYTQFIDADSRSIGCAVVEHCPDQNAALLCLYGEGNKGEPPYVAAGK